MIQWPKKSPPVFPIGVDIGFDGVKLLQCQLVDGRPSVLAAARAPIPETAGNDPAQRYSAAAALVRRMLMQNGFRGNRVALALPRGIVQVKQARLPMIPIEELDAAVQFEARNLFSFDTEKATIRFIPAGEVRHGNDVRQEVIVTAVQTEEIEKVLDRANAAGLEVDSLDLEPCAIYRGFERFIRRKADEDEVHVLVDVGAAQSQVIIGRGHGLCFFKAIDTGSQHLHNAVSRKLGITFDEARQLRRRLMNDQGAEAHPNDPVRQAVHDATRSLMEDLAREVSLCLRYYFVTFRGQKPTRVRVVGGEGNDARLVALLGGALPIPVESGRPLFSLDTSNMRRQDREGMMSEWTLALGLSLKRLIGPFKPLDGRSRMNSVVEVEPVATEPVKPVEVANA